MDHPPSETADGPGFFEVKSSWWIILFEIENILGVKTHIHIRKIGVYSHVITISINITSTSWILKCFQHDLWGPTLKFIVQVLVGIYVFNQVLRVKHHE